ncbi:MAG: nidogen-like domain-containing protein, partial [Rhodoglobus sp.]
LSGEDDESTTVALPFPINYNGLVANALCITTNGNVIPVATIADGCGSGGYDESLAEGAVGGEHSQIGVLLHDIDLGNSLWVTSVPLATVSSTAGEATFTTSVAHGFLVGEDVEVRMSPDDADLGPTVDSTVTNVADATTFTVFWGGPDFGSRAVSGVTGRPYDDAIDDSDTDGLADDGFGAVNQVYAGAATVDGKDAFVVTWYRVTGYENDNDPSLFDTFQIVILKGTPVGGQSYPFTVYFNFGTVQDNEWFDGYDATEPDSECDGEFEPENCRFAVGFAFYNAATDTATSQELFADVPKANLIDGGAQALVEHSLNSEVLGRYVLAYAYVPPVLAATGPETLVPSVGGALALLILGGGLLVARRRRVVILGR